MISAGSLIRGIFGLLGDIVWPSSYNGTSFTVTTVVGPPDCQTHLSHEKYIMS